MVSLSNHAYLRDTGSDERPVRVGLRQHLRQFSNDGIRHPSAGETPFDAVAAFFDQPPYPIQWQDVEYLWAELLREIPDNAHYGDYDRVYVETLRERWERG